MPRSSGREITSNKRNAPPMMGSAMNLELYETKGLKFWIRPGTSDLKSIKEVVEKNDYLRKDFQILSGERWLDLGAYIGAFSVLAASKGAVLTAFEPCANSFALLERNLSANAAQKQVEAIRAAVVTQKLDPVGGRIRIKASLGHNKNGNHWRNSIVRTPAQKGEELVGCVNLDPFLEGIDGVKMDIEGSEFEILENVSRFKNIKKLVYEHSFDVNNSIPVYLDIVRRLKEIFPNVKYKAMPEGAEKYTWFPLCAKVWAWK